MSREVLLEDPPVRWTCSECAEEYCGLSEPQDRICLDCERARDERQPEIPIEDLLEEAGVPWIYRQGWAREEWEKKFSQGWPAIVDSLASRSPRSTILIYGPTGTGKTGLATIVLAERLKRGERGLWVRAQTFLDTMTASFRDRSVDGSDLARAAHELAVSCRQVEVLVLDDLFAADRATPYARERFQEMLAERHDEGRITITTTNRSPKDLIRMFPSLGSRLLSQLILNLGGEDRRLQR